MVLITSGVIQVSTGRFIGFNESLGRFHTQRVAVPVEITHNSPRLTGFGLNFVCNFEITGCCFGDECPHTLLKAGFGAFDLVFVGVVVAATLKHGRPVEQGQTKCCTEGNIFHAPKNGVSAEGCHGLIYKMFDH